MKKILGLTLLLILSMSVGTFAQDYDHTIKAKDDMTFSWKIDKGMIHIKLTGKTTGWVGIGFNADDKMEGANFILGMVKGKKFKVIDHFGNGKRSHNSDKRMGGKSNVTNAKGSEINGVTEISFTIPLNSGDKYDKTINPNGDTLVYLALGAGRDSVNARHKNKYILHVNLSTGKYTMK